MTPTPLHFPMFLDKCDECGSQHDPVLEPLRTDRVIDTCLICNAAYDTCTTEYALLERINNGQPCRVGGCE